MAELEGFICDGPECGKTVTVQEAHGWLRVFTMVHPKGPEIRTPLTGTFCSARCLEEWAADRADELIDAPRELPRYWTEEAKLSPYL